MALREVADTSEHIQTRRRRNRLQVGHFPFCVVGSIPSVVGTFPFGISHEGMKGPQSLLPFILE